MQRSHWKVLYSAAALLGCAIILGGCGGSIGSTILPSPFVGQWNGSWTDASNAQEGEVSLTIAKNGDLAGTTSNTTLATQGSVSGSVHSTGEISATLTYPDMTQSADGVIVKNSSGHLVGTLQTSVNGSPHGTLSIDLVKE